MYLYKSTEKDGIFSYKPLMMCGEKRDKYWGEKQARRE